MCELQDVNCAIQRTGAVAANQTTGQKLTLNKKSYTKITTYMVNANIFNCRSQTNQQWSGQEQFFAPSRCILKIIIIIIRGVLMALSDYEAL